VAAIGAVLLVLVGPAAAMGAGGEPAFVSVFDSSGGAAITGSVLTSDGADTYVVGQSGGTVEVTAPTTNTHGNLRSLLTPTDPLRLEDSESCAAWSTLAGQNAQLGAAFRVRTGPGGRVRAVTITQNILFGARWLYNVHLWDSTAPEPMRKVATFNLAANGSTPPNVPMRLCARLVGDTISMKAWPEGTAEPTWGAANVGGSATLPVAARGVGTTGWFVGHLQAGDRVTMNALTIRSTTVARPAWYPFASADAFVRQQSVDLTGHDLTAPEAQAAAATITSPADASRFIDQRLDDRWSGSLVGSTFRLYRGYFLRPPDTEGLRYWVTKVRSGTRIAAASSSFAASSEFKRRYGALTNAAFVDRVYTNVLGRPGDAGGRQYWLQKLDAGTTRGAMMASFTESSENIRRSAPEATTETITFTLLGRAATAAELSAGAARLTAGEPRATLVDELLHDGEYSTRVGVAPLPPT
jgi:hypothetical protein